MTKEKLAKVTFPIIFRRDIMKHNKLKGTACILTGLMSISMTFRAMSLRVQDQQTFEIGTHILT